MLFRIEDISGFDPNLRTYDAYDFTRPVVSKAQIDIYISSKIRDEVNGSKSRELLSYSKSLATCLLKYNKFTDNELHICIINGVLDIIVYDSQRSNMKYKTYSIRNRINGKPLFNKEGKIRLRGFIIDVSDNNSVDEYLRYYTDTGKKIMASPEKDNEVVVMNPPNDLIIKEYIDAVYILYALQLKYSFLNNADVRKNLIRELEDMEESCFYYCSQEREAFILLVQYLHDYWSYEKEISRGIYEYSEKEEHSSICYDSILQFHGILDHEFEVAEFLGTYNDNAISRLLWKYCRRYLEYKREYNPFLS